MVAVVAYLGCSKGKLSPDASMPGGDANGSSDIRVAVDGSGAADVPRAGDGASSTDAPSNVCPPLSSQSTGKSCGGYAFGLVCDYSEPPPSVCWTRCQCGGSWICDRACTGPCPPNAPAEWSSCSAPTLTCLYPTACGERRLQCNAFEIGAPAYWSCSSNCSCDAGADAASDSATDTRSDAPETGLYCGGGVTCYGTDVCVILNDCGGPVNCQDTIDAGQCPPGSTLNPSCPGGRPGCIPDCTPPAPICMPKPAACTSGLNCGCVPFGFCPLGMCWRAEGRVAYCANQ